ncbi:MAG: hypothetical protein EOM76_12385, partial [Sphingobacteriia bacterium]|nr:hypothetical protein [Sphingobacteriia bacterium]
MNDNVSPKQLKDLRNEFEIYLRKRNPYWSNLTIGATKSDHFIAWCNSICIDFESIFDSEEALNASSMPMVWDYPPLSLLSANKTGKADRGDVKANAQVIENTLDSFGIRAKVVEYNPGPAVTQYALEITQGTRLAKITALSTDLALALAAPTGQIRIEAPIPGRNLVGVEVPNHSAETVSLKTMLSSPLMKKHPSKLAVTLGIDVSGKPMVADIANMPHLLIAGATGSGKSVCVNSFLCSILFRATPEEVKFILVDPK